MMHLPAWCTASHATQNGGHTADIGEVELGDDLTLAVALLKIEDRPTQIQLIEHTDDETRVLGLDLGEALELRDLVVTATTHVLQERAW